MKKIVIYTLAFILSLFAPLVLAFDDGSGRYPSDPKPKPVTEKLPPKYKFPEKRPTAKTVAGILKNGGGLALAQGVADILGAGVDWVLDPDNNAIRYPTNPDDITGYDVREYGGDTYPTMDALCRSVVPRARQGATFIRSYLRTAVFEGAQVFCDFVRADGQNDYFTAGTLVKTKAKEKTISLEEVAEQVIKNADKGHQPSVDVANEAVQKESPDDETDPNNKPKDDPETGTKDKDEQDEKDKEKSKEKDFPDFCNWATKVCDFIDWAKQEPEQPKQDKDQELDIEEKEMIDPSNFDQDYLVYGGQCPVFNGFTISIGSQSVNLSFDITPLCDFVIAVRPAVIALAYLAGMGIVANAIREI